MATSVPVLFRVACICGLLRSLTLKAFVINDRIPPGHKPLHPTKTPSYYEYYIDDNNNDGDSVLYDYPERGVKNKRYFGPEELRESVKEDLAEVISDKPRFKSLQIDGFTDVNKNVFSEDNEGIGNEIDNIYQHLIDKTNLLNSKNEMKGIENSYEVETKITENNSDGVKGVAKVEGEVIQKTYNGSEPVVKVVKVHASATNDGKDGKDGGWKLHPIKSEFEIVSPKSGKVENHQDLKKEESYLKTRNGQDELEQILIGDDYDVEAINEYLNKHRKDDKSGVKNKEKAMNNNNNYIENNSRTVKKSFPHREKRTVHSKQAHNKESSNASVRKKGDKDDDVNLLKRYIALQDAENHSLMRALDLASEIEFEQQEKKINNKSKQAKLLEEQMLQMRKALSNEKMLGEIKKIFEDNYRMKRFVLKKKFDLSKEKQQDKKMPSSNQWNRSHVRKDYDYENDGFNDFMDESKYPVLNESIILPKTMAEEDEIAERLKMIQEARMFRNDRDFSDYEGIIRPNEKAQRFENPYKRFESYGPYIKNNQNLADAQKDTMMNEYVMKKVGEYVLEKEKKADRERELRQALKLKKQRNVDYSLQTTEGGYEGGDGGDYDDPDLAPDYPLDPVYEDRTFVPKYKRKTESCSTGMVDNCRLPRMRGLILDDDAIGLCNLHQMCYKCGSSHGYNADDCHHMYFQQVRSYCQGDHTCMKQAQVLFLNMLEDSSFEMYSQPLCAQPCIKEKLSSI